MQRVTAQYTCHKCGQAFEDSYEAQPALCPQCQANNGHKSYHRICLDCRIQFVGGLRSRYCPKCRSTHKRGPDKSIRIRRLKDANL